MTFFITGPVHTRGLNKEVPYADRLRLDKVGDASSGTREEIKSR